MMEKMTAKQIKEIEEIKRICDWHKLSEEEKKFNTCLTLFILERGVGHHKLKFESAIKTMGVCYRMQKMVNHGKLGF